MKLQKNDKDHTLVANAQGGRVLVRRKALRIAFLFAVALVIFAGLRTIFFPKGQAAPIRGGGAISVSFPDEEAKGFALAFTRAYLTYDTAHPERREKQLSRYLSGDIDTTGGLVLGQEGRQSVSYVNVAAAKAGEDKGTVTVAYGTDAGESGYLEVPLAKDGSGRLAVSDYPAVVPGPRHSHELSSAGGGEIDTPAVRQVTERALSNYLAGEASNLNADVEPGQSIAPVGGYRLVEITELRRIREAPKKVVAVAVVLASPGGQTEQTLSYQVSLTRKDRWYVQSISAPYG